MKNGFYDTSGIGTKSAKKKFIRRALELSYRVDCQCKYRNDVSHRETETESSVEEYVNDMLTDPRHRMDLIDRNFYNRGSIVGCDGEFNLHSTWNSKTGRKYWRLLYGHMSLDNLHKLAAEFGLKMRDK